MNKKEEIVKAATNLFSTYSYKKVTMDEIAKIEYPYVGMMFYCKETDKYYSVKSLKSASNSSYSPTL